MLLELGFVESGVGMALRMMLLDRWSLNFGKAGTEDSLGLGWRVFRMSVGLSWV